MADAKLDPATTAVVLIEFQARRAGAGEQRETRRERRWGDTPPRSVTSQRATSAAPRTLLKTHTPGPPHPHYYSKHTN